MNVKPLLFLCLLILFSIGVAQANVSANSFTLYIGANGSIGFNSDKTHFVLVNATSGSFNSSDASLTMDSRIGTFRFRQNETLTFQVTFNTTKCVVQGDQGNEGRTITTGDSFTANPLNVVYVSWVIDVEPYLPLRFILGMVGLCLMFASPIYSIIQFKKREYYNAIRNSAILLPIGICFVIAWLWI